MRLAFLLSLALLLAACAGQPVQTDDEKAFAATKAHAEAGDVAAERELSLMYWQGRGVAAGGAEGINLRRKAADAGDAEAEGQLGYVYMNGIDGLVPKDQVRSFGLELQSAKQGYLLAETAVGEDYLH